VDEVEDDFPEDCGEIQSGVMPDGRTRYHLVGRMWNDTRQAELLVLESEGCFRLVGDLGWNTMAESSSEVLSTRLEALDLDADGRDDAAFRIVERLTDASTYPVETSKFRSARYCRVAGETWECTEVLTRRPRAEDWDSSVR
jgi:hypothetical protein